MHACNLDATPPSTSEMRCKFDTVDSCIVHAGGQRDPTSPGEAKGARAGALHWHHWPAPQNLPLHSGQVSSIPSLLLGVHTQAEG